MLRRLIGGPLRTGPSGPDRCDRHSDGAVARYGWGPIGARQWRAAALRRCRRRPRAGPTGRSGGVEQRLLSGLRRRSGATAVPHEGKRCLAPWHSRLSRSSARAPLPRLPAAPVGDRRSPATPVGFAPGSHRELPGMPTPGTRRHTRDGRWRCRRLNSRIRTY